MCARDLTEPSAQGPWPTSVIEPHADQARLVGAIKAARLMERFIGEQ